MRQKPQSCVGCACHSHGSDFSSIEGTGASGLMLVGEASGEHEQRDQLPFRPYAPAGGVLSRVLLRMSLDRESLSITNVLRCRPRNNWLDGAPWEFSAIASCRNNLEAAILERRPRAILALGGIATRELTGLAGEAQGVSHLAGYVLPCHISSPTQPVPVIPNFHPSYLRRGKSSHQGVFARVLQRALNVARGRDQNWLWNIDPEDPSSHVTQGYEVRPTVAVALAYSRYVLDNPQLVVSYDLETAESASLDEDAREGFRDTDIRLVQFAVAGRGAVAIPWLPEFLPAIEAVLHSPNPKCGHNVWLFDNKVLKAAGARHGRDFEPRGLTHDTLQMFHHWQPDLPAHLQFAASFVSFPFPWKHLAASHIEFYGCCDVDATLRLYNMLEATLKRDGLWGDAERGYLGQVYEVRPVLAGMEDRGVPIDDSARLALDREFDVAQRDLGVALAKEAPAECCRVQPKQGYKGVPPEVKSSPVWLAGENHLITAERFIEPGDDGESYHYEQRVFGDTLRWCRVYDFNPNSRQQVIDYMRAKGHPVPKDKHRENDKGENPDTTSAKELLRLASKTGDLFYQRVVEYRGLTKMRGTYVPGFAPSPDGAVHTTFTFDTGIGQLSSRNPNVQNFPKLKPTVALAKAMRRMIAARPGHVISEWDFKSCHVITLGFLAEDLNYMRLGRLDIHSFVAGHFLNLWDGFKIFSEPDEALLARFKHLKSNPAWKLVRDDQAKHGILGIGNGLKAKGLYERYMESFPPQTCEHCKGTGRTEGLRGMKKCGACRGEAYIPGQRIAERVLETCEALFPRVFAYQRVEAKRAHEQQQLVSPFAHVRRFYEVFRWDTRRNDWASGDQHEQAVAFRLANIAFGHIREKLKDLHTSGLAERYGLFNNVHDSFMFHFPERDLDQHVADVYPVLTAPSRVLKHPAIAPDGLVIGVEASYGPHWADMREVVLPKLRLRAAEAVSATVTV